MTLSQNIAPAIWQRRRWIIRSCLLLLVATAIWVIADLRRVQAIAVKPAKPPERIDADINGLLRKLEEGGGYEPSVDFAAIDGACRYLDSRWAFSSRGVLANSPGYWVGNGCNPDAAQDRKVVLVIYDVSERKGFGEKSPLKLSHACFPRKFFEESSVEGTRALAFDVPRRIER